MERIHCPKDRLLRQGAGMYGDNYILLRLIYQGDANVQIFIANKSTLKIKTNNKQGRPDICFQNTSIYNFLKINTSGKL